MTIDPQIFAEQQRSNGSWIKWAAIGDTHRIVVATAKFRTATEYGTGKPLTWDDNSAKQELLLTGTDPGTGESINMVIKWWSNQKHALLTALGGQPLEVGGTFAMQWTGEEPVPNYPQWVRKTWRAQWIAPKPVAIAADDLI